MVGRVLLLALAVALIAAGTAVAAPAGPQLAVLGASQKPPRAGVLTVTPDGRISKLTMGGLRSRPFPDFFSSISWSPDGERVAFSGIVGSHKGDDHEAIRRLFTVSADGSDRRPIPGTNGATDPVFAPDGRTVAFTRAIEREATPTEVGGKRYEEGFSGASIWTVDLASGKQRQLTPWEEGVEYVASSFSPDGKTLLATHEDERLLREAEPVALDLESGSSRRLLEDGETPVYSPDGSEIALVRRTISYGKERDEASDLWVIDADSGKARRLTRTPNRETAPSWDPSGRRLAYIRYSLAGTEVAVFGAGDALMQINADGSCATKITSAPKSTFLAPAWRPGPGRGAGPIRCGAAAAASAGAAAAEPAGPRLAVARENWNPARITMLTVGADGSRPLKLAGGQRQGPLDTITIAPLSWSPDGTEIAFTGINSIALVRADGGGAHLLNLAAADFPVFAPDGGSIAFRRYGERNGAIWTLDLESGAQRQLTPARRRIAYLPSSFSADGSTLLATRLNYRRHRNEPVALDLQSGEITNLLGDGLEPVYSPDGAEIALLRAVGKQENTDLFVLDTATRALRRLTRTPRKSELFPSWDPSGKRIAFTRYRGEHYEWANSIVEINADGSCETEVLARKRTVFYGAAWQPGPGRGAGPIECRRDGR